MNYYCDICTLDPIIAGSGFTKYVCKCCGKAGDWSNTYTPKICIECGKKSKRCIACLGSLATHKLSDEFKEQYRKMKDRKWTIRNELSFYEDKLFEKIKKQCSIA